jgi:hypothetical protein
MLLCAAVLGGVSSAGASSNGSPPLDPRLDTKAEALQWIKTHGYLPFDGIDKLQASKAHAAEVVAAQTGKPVVPQGNRGAAPIIGASWQGVSSSSVSPADANGAIGPNSYLEIINQTLGIYNRSGGLITSASLTVLTGHSNVSDPMILWDPASQRFFYNVWDTSAQTQEWGFSKTDNPTAIPTGFCNYTASFGYNPSLDLPDYPKLGQTADFLMIGVNHYTSPNFAHADRTDLMWISKYKDPNPVTTCPSSATFTTGIFKDLRNADNSIGFTPVPAIQTDSSPNGFVMTMSDIECPDICGTGTLMTTHAFRPNPQNPAVPQFQIKGRSITVGSYMPPPDAPQKGTANTLDTLDGRLTHAVSGIDPAHSNKLGIWVSHSVVGGAGSQVNWYEINPLPVNHPALIQSGTVSDPSLWLFNSGISNDRACDLAGCAHGDSMVVGFTTSSSTAFPASQMVSKIGLGAQSGLVLVKQSSTFDNDFTCFAPFGPPCRWGDYGGATPDPTKKTGSTGEVWLSNQWTDGTNETWNWEATP